MFLFHLYHRGLHESSKIWCWPACVGITQPCPPPFIRATTVSRLPAGSLEWWHVDESLWGVLWHTLLDTIHDTWVYPSRCRVWDRSPQGLPNPVVHDWVTKGCGVPKVGHYVLGFSLISSSWSSSISSWSSWSASRWTLLRVINQTLHTQGRRTLFWSGRDIVNLWPLPSQHLPFWFFLTL